ncbi:hypothetical protein QUA41_16470 [Microcoleus sp. Pol11C1]|uniref:hypothetical protein n=1 Tax=Microcoleus sp. POL1_C1 TaxID=2818870 RepID=UPI002FD1BF7A
MSILLADVNENSADIPYLCDRNFFVSYERGPGFEAAGLTSGCIPPLLQGLL